MSQNGWSQLTAVEKATIIGSVATVLALVVAVVALWRPSGSSAPPATNSTGVGAPATTGPAGTSQPSQPSAPNQPTGSGAVPGTEAFLADQDSVNRSADMRTGAAILDGQTYLHSLLYQCVTFCNDPQGVVEYNLGGRYRQFSATVGVADDAADSDQVAVFEVYVDGVRKAHQEVAFGRPKPITVDVTGGLRLRLLASEPGIENPLQAGVNIAAGVPNHLPDVAWADARVRG